MNGGSINQDRLFLDANILFSASRVADAGLQILWQLPRVQLLTSTYAVVEATRNLIVPESLMRLSELLRSVRVVQTESASVHSVEGINLPAKDVPILVSAVSSGATHLLTGDRRHFGPWFGQKYDGVLIVPPAQYLRERT